MPDILLASARHHNLEENIPCSVSSEHSHSLQERVEADSNVFGVPHTVYHLRSGVRTGGRELTEPLVCSSTDRYSRGFSG